MIVPSLFVRLLGGIELRVKGEPLTFPASRKTRALLGFLVAAPGAHRRERLCSLLWEGPDDPRAQLRWSLAKLRPLLDTDGLVRLIADREHVRFDGTASAVDVWELGASAARLDEAPIAELRRLEELSRGELMEGLDLPDAYRFQQWLVAEREVKRGLRVRVLRQLMLRLAGEPAEALAIARAWIQVEPFAD
ncbi:MAG: ATP-binding protein, partial [Thermoanaerobaculia bacterium]